jgi:parallel beta-helix repeat protein
MNGMDASRINDSALDDAIRSLRSEVRIQSQRDRVLRDISLRGTRKGRAVLIVLVTGLAATLILGASQLEIGGDNGPLKAHTSYTTHAPIIIWMDAGFNATNGVSSGTGAADDPYIIFGWEIDSESMDACVFVFRTTAHFVIRDCYLHYPGAVCLETEEAPHGDIVNCVIDTGDYGIILVKSPDTNITGNVISNMDSAGIVVSQSRWVNVTGNQATQGSLCGIGVATTHNGRFENNTASDNDASGLLVANSTDLLIAGNNASGNMVDGLRLDNVSNVEVRGNNITSNGGIGLNLTRSTFTDIFHNRFIGNSVQAYQEEVSDVAWDDGYPSGGNYWSDYSGVDLFNGPDQDIDGADGTGDTPYAVLTGGTDRYPFMTESMEPIPEFSALVLPIFVTAIVCGAFLRSRKRM